MAFSHQNRSDPSQIKGCQGELEIDTGQNQGRKGFSLKGNFLFYPLNNLKADLFGNVQRTYSPGRRPLWPIIKKTAAILNSFKIFFRCRQSEFSTNICQNVVRGQIARSHPGFTSYTLKSSESIRVASDCPK